MSAKPTSAAESATVLRLPASLPALPACEPFAPTTTPEQVCRQLDDVERALFGIRTIADRLFHAAEVEGEAATPERDSEDAAAAWHSEHVQPLVDTGWSDSSGTWAHQLTCVEAAIRNVAEHLVEWQPAADRVERISKLHAAIGTRLGECGRRVREAANARHLRTLESRETATPDVPENT